MDREKFERNLNRASRLETLTRNDDFSIVNELINEEITFHANEALSDKCTNDHNLYLRHTGAIDGLKGLQSKFTTVERLGKEAVASLERLDES